MAFLEFVVTDAKERDRTLQLSPSVYNTLLELYLQDGSQINHLRQTFLVSDPHAEGGHKTTYGLGPPGAVTRPSRFPFGSRFCRGGFVWARRARRALNDRKRRFSARAVSPNFVAATGHAREDLIGEVRKTPSWPRSWANLSLL
jgi:hypothetical protein